MALQTKTFSWGSYEFQSDSNAYVIELTLTENYIDQVNNRSNISYALVLKSGSNNRFTGQIDSVINLARIQVASGSRQISAAYNSSWTLLEGTTDVNHDLDGTLDMPIEVSINTYNSYAPPDATMQWSWALTNIPRASTFGAITGTIIGGTMRVNINRNSDAYSHSFWYEDQNGYGGWSSAIDLAAGVDHIEFELPMYLAERSKQAQFGLQICLRTKYGDQNVGEDLYQTVQVTVPENDDTRPTVTLALAPVNGFEGLYLQGRTKLQGTLSAEGKYGADIVSLTLTVDGKAYEKPWLSDVLVTTGKLPVVATAVDSRGFTTTVEQEIEVVPYYRPTLTAEAYRCLEEGPADDAGEFLMIDATVEFASVAEKNNASLLYRYRTEGGQYGKDIPLAELEAMESGGVVTRGPLLEGTLKKENAYSLQIVLKDSVGEEAPVTVAIPSELIYKHKRPGGKGLGLGGYCGKDDLLDVHWDAWVRKNLQVDGNLMLGDGTLKDFVVEEGTDGVWTWQKYAGGIMKCWATVTKTLEPAGWEAWGAMYGATVTEGEEYPVAFVGLPKEFYNITSQNGWIIGCTRGQLDEKTKTHTHMYYAIRATAPDIPLTCLLDIYAVGRWK